jgi:hypothetical protein
MDSHADLRVDDRLPNGTEELDGQTARFAQDSLRNSAPPLAVRGEDGCAIARMVVGCAREPSSLPRETRAPHDARSGRWPPRAVLLTVTTTHRSPHGAMMAVR